VAQNESGIDLALVIDGSGSISSDDFTLQKQGLKAALENTLIFPRTGSIAVTIIQFAGSTTRVHIPYTVIDNDITVASLINQVDGIRQLGGSTNPGDGINSANSIFNASGNSSNQQVICMSTDGLPNAGANVPTALNTAKNSIISLDKFSVIAIEDPPSYYEPDFQDYYGPLVFGGGAVTVVRNSVEYANVLGSTCLPANIELVGIEVIQTIQDWNNSAPLVENKTTYVRAHIQPLDSQNTVVARARLRGYRDGVELTGSPLTAESPGYIIARANAAQRRSIIGDSLNFRLPHDWLNGSVELRVEGLGGLNCHESAGLPNDCSVTVTFSRTDRLEIEFVGIEWSEDGNTYEVLPGHYSELAERLRAIYPIASDTTGLDWRWDEMKWDSIFRPSLLAVLARLELMQASDLCFSSLGCERIYYGVLRGPSASNIGGLAIIGGNVSSGFLPDDEFTYGRNRHAHEIGHNLGRGHAVHGPLIDPTIAPFDEYKEGWCGETAPLDAEEFPISGQVSGMTVATISALDVGNDAILYGIDTNINQDIHNRNRVVIDPREHFELMSYCGLPNAPFAQSTFRWISEYTYEILRNEINNRFNPVNLSEVEVPITYLAVRGFIDNTSDQVEFLPFSQISSTVPINQQSQGEYVLRLSDQSGTTVSATAFQPSEIAADLSGEDPGKKIFMILVPHNPNAYQATIMHDGASVGEFSRSQNSPTINIVYPNGGEYLSGQTVTLSWTSADIDGDILSHVIQYSRDGGATWETLTADWPHQAYQVNLSELGESNSGLIRVTASDGFNVESDTSDSTFTTPNNPPEAHIHSPFDGQAFIGVENVILAGSAVDREEEHLIGSSLEWTSDLDGFIGTGDNFLINASQLSDGNHTITLTATDSGGLTSTASVNVVISRLNPSLPPPGDFNKAYPLMGAIHIPTNITLNWGTSDGATSYEYCYDTMNDNSCNWINNGPDTTVLLTGLSINTTYYWHVRAINSVGVTYSNTDDTAFFSFTTVGFTQPEDPIFDDVPANYWARDFIERLYQASITGGCATNPLRYCPEASVTRAQMAVFLLRGIHGSAYSPPAVNSSTGFTDVPINYWAGAWIKQLAAEDITGGCGTNLYCPEAPVTRAQMAVFLLRSTHGASYNPPAVGSSTGFTDVPTNYWAGAWIKQLVAEAITSGCGASTYCPESPVTRAQMAVFLVRTFNLP
jgi:hypothetical protein